MTTDTTVFISYSREDEIWRARIAERFARHGIAVWDDTHIGYSQRWRDEIARHIAESTGAVILLSKNSLESEFIRSSEVPLLKEKEQRGGYPVFPIEIGACDWESDPWLSERHVARVPAGDEYQTGVVLAAIVRDIADILRRDAETDHEPPPRPARLPARISLGRLPRAGSMMIGRGAELLKLDQAWDAAGTNLAFVVGFGGTGKTALVNAWLSRLAQGNFKGAEMVYGWSFANADDAEKETSGDAFLDAALTWFGDPNSAQGSPWEKGLRLAELVRKQRTLLVLDGIEALQQPRGERGGELRDTGLQSLLSELSWYNPGLCLITTRLAVEGFEQPSVLRLDLVGLSPEDGGRYLARLGVQGSDSELQDASREVGGQALSLTLLGKYLVAACRGDVRQRDHISATPDSHATGIMERYERWLAGTPELRILLLVSLFDRPTDPGALAALRSAPTIAGLTEEVRDLSEEAWRAALANLRNMGLLNPEAPEEPDRLDAHPLVREYFGRRLRNSQPNAWKTAQERLYENCVSRTRRDQPDTFEEMIPLFFAIRHGCEAGLHQTVWDDVYMRRTRRNGEFYSTQKLGAFGADLAALACFFDHPWDSPVADLTETDKGILLNEAGEALRALGRLHEAIPPLRAAEQINRALGRWATAAVNLGNSSQLHLAIGDVDNAIHCGRAAVELAENSGDPFQRMVRRCDLANALCHFGALSEAAALFNTAERIQETVAEMLRTTDSRVVPRVARLEWRIGTLHAVRGFQYCDLLLEAGRFEDVRHYAAKALEIDQDTGRPLHVGLDHLCLGLAALGGSLEHVEGLVQAAYHLDQAMIHLRRCGRRDYLPRGLVALAELHRVRDLFSEAHLELDEALAVAARDGMMLHQADCHLGFAALYLSMKSPDKARQSLNAAARVIERTGYHRRDTRLREIEARL